MNIKKYHQLKQYAEDGFTIVELMIATTIFSVILVIISAGVVAFTRDYYKAINSSTTQNAARTLIDTVTQAIQFNDTDVVSAPVAIPPAPPVQPTTYCIGGLQFDFQLGVKVDTTYGAIWQTPTSSVGGCTPLSSPAASSQQLLGPNMRLSKFSIQKLTDNLYTIDVRVVYGEDDLLCSPHDIPGSCDPGYGNLSTAQLAAARDLTCKSQTGSQFCSQSELNTTAQVRGIAP